MFPEKAIRFLIEKAQREAKEGAAAAERLRTGAELTRERLLQVTQSLASLPPLQGQILDGAQLRNRQQWIDEQLRRERALATALAMQQVDLSAAEKVVLEALQSRKKYEKALERFDVSQRALAEKREQKQTDEFAANAWLRQRRESGAPG